MKKVFIQESQLIKLMENDFINGTEPSDIKDIGPGETTAGPNICSKDDEGLEFHNNKKLIKYGKTFYPQSNIISIARGRSRF